MRVRGLPHTTYLVFFLLLASFSISSAQSGNLLQDPGFDEFYSSDSGSGAWKPFKLSNPGPAIFRHLQEGWPKGPSALIYGDAIPFDGGIYQRVGVTPGKGYNFSLAWAASRFSGGSVQAHEKMVRVLGIDSFGGIDARSPNVVWSAEYRGAGKCARPCSELSVDAHARADKLTVFIRVINEYTDARAEVFIDSATLQENGAPPIAITPPTNTLAPVATTRPATATSVRTRVAVAATAAPSLTATSTPASAETRAPTATRTPRAILTPPVENPALGLADLVVPLTVGACLLVGLMGLAGAGLLLLIKR